MLYSKLTYQDIDNFCSYVQAYGASYDYPANEGMADPAFILRYWNANKVRLFHAFGEKFILERPIEYAMNRDELTSMFYSEDFYNQYFEPFSLAYHQAIDDCFEKWTDDWYALRYLLSSDNICTNRVHNGNRSQKVIFPNTNIVTIEEDAKFMKVLGKVCKNLGLSEEFEQFRIQHSILLNQKVIKGTLCLSIHPMDYITMSDNNQGWSTCMSWMEDGDYRRGTVEMMNSECAVVAYLKSDDKTMEWNGGHNSWNSKKWRTLIIADTQLLATIKDYPYHNDELLSTALEWMRELMNSSGVAFSEPAISAVYGQNIRYENRSIKWKCDTGVMYNDFGACKSHWVSVADSVKDGYWVEVYYSGPEICMNCGQNGSYFDDSNNVFGDCCCAYDEKIWCYHCGDRVWEDEVEYVNGLPYCCSCYDYLFVEDELDGVSIDNNDAILIFLAREKDTPKSGDFVIRTHINNCDESYYNAETGAYRQYALCAPRVHCDSGRYYWNIDDVTDAGLKSLFGIYNLNDYNAN